MSTNDFAPELAAEHSLMRERLDTDRVGKIHKFKVGGHKGYIRTGEYPDGRLGEIFIEISKEGSTVSGMINAFATSISIALQYGVPLEVLASKFVDMRFEPSGITGNEEIPEAVSILDYIFRYLLLRYGE